MIATRTHRPIIVAATCLFVSGCQLNFSKFPAQSISKGAAEETVDAAAQKPRWKLPKGRIAYRAICADFRAPAVPDPMPPEGVIPAFLFAVDKASDEHIENHRSLLNANGFAVGDGTVTINEIKILFATGDGGVLKTQRSTDRLYAVMCEADGPQIQMVAMRLNDVSEPTRMS